MGTTTEKYKGKAKRIEGQVTGDKLREAQGVAKELTAEVKNTVDTIAKAAKDLARKASKRVESLADRATRKH
jgi:uncharacterized protein YjbJ (UPF0337 family)